MNPMWFVRMARWVRRPPSRRQAAVMGGVIVAGLLMAGIESLWGWPDWLTPDRLRP
jgi:hypothetical protein